jgi:hypothetical protein
MKIVVEFTKNDLIHGIVYNVGEIAGFDDWIAENLLKSRFAVLHGDGKPKVVGHRVPDGMDSGYWAGEAAADRIAALKQRSA